MHLYNKLAIDILVGVSGGSQSIMKDTGSLVPVSATVTYSCSGLLWSHVT